MVWDLELFLVIFQKKMILQLLKKEITDGQSQQQHLVVW